MLEEYLDNLQRPASAMGDHKTSMVVSETIHKHTGKYHASTEWYSAGHMTFSTLSLILYS